MSSTSTAVPFPSDDTPRHHHKHHHLYSSNNSSRNSSRRNSASYTPASGSSAETAIAGGVNAQGSSTGPSSATSNAKHAGSSLIPDLLRLDGLPFSSSSASSESTSSTAQSPARRSVSSTGGSAVTQGQTQGSAGANHLQNLFLPSTTQAQLQAGYKPPPPSSASASASVASSPHRRFHSSGSSATAAATGGGGAHTFHYHPRQPGPSSESYFSGALLPPPSFGGQNHHAIGQGQGHMHASGQQGHSRTVSSGSGLAHLTYDWRQNSSGSNGSSSNTPGVHEGQREMGSASMSKSHSAGGALPAGMRGLAINTSTGFNGGNGANGKDGKEQTEAPLSAVEFPQGQAPTPGAVTRSKSMFVGALSSLGFGSNGGNSASPNPQRESQIASTSHPHQQQQQQAGALSSGYTPAPVPASAGGAGAFGTGTGRPPSPSTLTDVILGLHATLYGGKRKPEQVREMVGKYYESGAVFESPLLSAHGREQIANQFIMAFSLPGLDVRSELRDVICSDFEFDGTRAGIIDQTLTITFLPWLFGKDNLSQEAEDAAAEAAAYAHHYQDMDSAGGAVVPPGYMHGANDYGFGGYGGAPGQSVIDPRTQGGTAPVTPHPFANYQTPGASAFSRFGASGMHAGPGGMPGVSGPHSPTTPYSHWPESGRNSVGNSRPHTPGHSSMGPLSSAYTQTHTRGSSVLGDDDDDDDDEDGYGHRRHAGSSMAHVGTAGAAPSTAGQSGILHTHYAGAGGGAAAESSSFGATIGGALASMKPSMPQDAIQPHWSNEGFGRRSFRSLMWGVLHPRKALKSLCSIQLRLMSRLEFNDAGMVVRHEDTWGMREALEGIIPFASVIYPIHRRVVGTLVSFSIANSINLRDSFMKSLPMGQRAPDQLTGAHTSTSGQSTPIARQSSHAIAPSEDPRAAAVALLQRTHAREPHVDHYHTIARSRNTSPNRYRWASERGYQTGTRSRTRSLIGGGQAASGSHDNLSSWIAHQAQHGGDRDIPPDSSARYRAAAAKRMEGGRTTSTTSAPPSTLGHGDAHEQASNPLASLWDDHAHRAPLPDNDRS